MSNLPKRYRLLKDLPGCPKGTVLFTATNGDLVATNGKTTLIYSQDLLTHDGWLESIAAEPERPYPWEPETGEDYWYLRSDGSVSELTFDNTTWHESLARNGGTYRTKEDAELRLKVEPSTNKAVQALINERHGLYRAEHCHVMWNGITQEFGVNGCSCASPYMPHGPRYATKETADDVAAHFNFFLSNPHE